MSQTAPPSREYLMRRDLLRISTLFLMSSSRLRLKGLLLNTDRDKNKVGIGYKQHVILNIRIVIALSHLS